MVEHYDLLTVEGPAIAYDRSRQLPPDEVSEELAREAAKAVRFWRWANYDTDAPARVLVPGVGPGTLPHVLLAHLQKSGDISSQKPIHIDAFDINPDAVETARTNLAHFAGKASLSYDVFEGDWTDDAMWDGLAREKYNVVLFNPPYLPTSETRQIRDGYAATPMQTLDGGPDGPDHYRQVIPPMVDVIDGETAANEMLFRFRTPGNEQTETIRQLFIDNFKGRRHFGLRLFPSEGPVMRRPGQTYDEQRWISFGVLCVNPPTELQHNYMFQPTHYKIDSCMARGREWMRFQ